MNPSISVLSDLKVAGALVFDKGEIDFPLNPKPGTLILKGQDIYGYVLVKGMLTWYPMLRSASDAYIHTQGEANLVWTVTHNLGTNNIWYQIKDSNGAIVSPNKFETLSANQFRITFTEAIVGTVIVVGANSIDVPDVKAQLIEVGTGVVINSSGVTINGVQVLTSATTTISDGVGHQFTVASGETLQLVAGNNITLDYDVVNKKIVVNSTGGGSGIPPVVTPNYQIGLIDVSSVDNFVITEAALSAFNTFRISSGADGDMPVQIPAVNSRIVIENKLKAPGVINVRVAGHAASLAIPNGARTMLTCDGTLVYETTTVQKSSAATKVFSCPVSAMASITLNEVDLSYDLLRFIDGGEASAIINYSADTCEILVVNDCIMSAIEFHSNGALAGIVRVENGERAHVINDGINLYKITIPDSIGSPGTDFYTKDLSVSGDLHVAGATVTIDAMTVTTKDSIIELNHGELGAGVTNGSSGLSVDRGSLPAYQIMFDETDDMFKVGQVGNLQTLASQNFVAAAVAVEVTNRDGAIAGAMAGIDSNTSALINTAMTAEITARNNAIANAINAEVTTRNNADVANTAAINTEATARAAADAAEVTARNAAIAAALASFVAPASTGGALSGNFPGPVVAQVGTARMYPVADITIKGTTAWLSGNAVGDVVANIRKNGVVVKTVTITSGTSLAKGTANVAVLSTDYITLDIVSGNGNDLTIRMEY
jgi:hypothetical protein